MWPREQHRRPQGPFSYIPLQDNQNAKSHIEIKPNFAIILGLGSVTQLSYLAAVLQVFL